MLIRRIRDFVYAAMLFVPMSFVKAPVVNAPDVNAPELHSTYHPIFISVTEINHNPKDKDLEIACKIFTEDLETVLAKATGAKIDLIHPKDTVLTGRQIQDYIGKHLVLRLDGKPVVLSFIGFEREQDAVWSYFQVNNIAAAPKTVSIMNNLLYENYPQQINLMHVTIGGKRQSTKLDNPESAASFSW
jgi:uncharacterized protein DUF6702